MFKKLMDRFSWKRSENIDFSTTFIRTGQCCNFVNRNTEGRASSNFLKFPEK